MTFLVNKVKSKHRKDWAWVLQIRSAIGRFAYKTIEENKVRGFDEAHWNEEFRKYGVGGVLIVFQSFLISCVFSLKSGCVYMWSWSCVVEVKSQANSTDEWFSLEWRIRQGAHVTLASYLVSFVYKYSCNAFLQDKFEI